MIPTTDHQSPITDHPSSVYQLPITDYRLPITFLSPAHLSAFTPISLFALNLILYPTIKKRTIFNGL